MAKFCTKCGKPLQEGEVCSCQQGAQQAAPGAQQSFAGAQQTSSGAQQSFTGTQQTASGAQQSFTGAQQNFGGAQQPGNGGAGNGSAGNGGTAAAGGVNGSAEKVDVFETLHQISQKIGYILDCIYNFFSPAKTTGKFTNMIPVRNLLGFSREDRLAAMGDCYERDKKVVPDLIQPCGQEIPIRQYDLCCCRSLLRGLWQEGKLQITNKRVLFRLSGRNWVGKALTSVEFSLDEIAGMDIKTSNKLSLVSLFMNTFYLGIFAGIGAGLASLSAEMAAVLGLFVFLAAHILVRRHYYFKVAVTAFASYGLTAGMMCWNNRFWAIMMIVNAVLMIVYLLIASLKPSLDIKVLAKCNSSGPIEVQRESVFGKVFNWGMEVLPGKDALRAMDEVGTMINDIQRFGDFGIEKWKE